MVLKSTASNTQADQPMFAGTQVPVAHFFEALADGQNVDAFLAANPSVERQQVLRLLDEALMALGTMKVGWPAAVMNFRGDPDFPAFESYRDELLASHDDPLL